MKQPALFVHCGLHKTATTSLQAFCNGNREMLRAHGLLYPETQDGDAAHHNLAWEVAGDRRFRPDGFTLAGLAETLSFPGDVLVSSEDFESVLHRPDVMGGLAQQLAAMGRAVHLVIYVREREDYKISLYLELLKHGYAEPFAAFDKAARTGRFHYRDWVFQFDHSRLLASLAELPGVRVHCRDFHRDGDPGTVFRDFLAVLDVRVDDPGPLATDRANARTTPAESLAMFCASRLGRPAHVLELCEGLALVHPDGSGGHPPGSLPGRIDRVFSNQTIGHIAAAGPPETLRAWWCNQRQESPQQH